MAGQVKLGSDIPMFWPVKHIFKICKASNAVHYLCVSELVKTVTSYTCSNMYQLNKGQRNTEYFALLALNLLR